MPSVDDILGPPTKPSVNDILGPPSTSKPEPKTTASGIAASLGRGAAPYAAGAALGAAAGAPFGGIGAVPGAIAGISATGLSQFGGSIYNWLGAPFGHFSTPQEVTDKALDTIGVKRPATTAERAAESVAGFLGGMGGIKPTASTPKPSARPLLKDFESQGVTPTVPTVGQGRGTALASQIGNTLPVTGPVVRGAVTKNLAETEAAANRNAANLGTARETSDAGSVVRNALNRFATDKSQATLDYGNFFRSMAGAAAAPMTNTMRVVNEFMGRFPNAPGLTGLFTQSPIARLKQELEPRTVNVPAQLSKTLDASGNPIVLKPAQTIQTGGKLAISELQELRSQVGYQLEHPNFGPDAIPRAQLKRLYAALTKDMQTAAKTQGPAAERALARATTNYATRMRLIDRLEPLVSGEAPERVFTKLNSAALSSASADAGLLRTAKQVMTPEEWGDFGSTIVSRLGKPNPGVKDILSGSDFSVSSYVTNWNKLSDRAKDLLFGPEAPGTPRASLEELARVAQAQKNVGKLANASRSGEYGIGAFLGWEAAQAAWGALTAGKVMPLVGWGAASGTGYGFAKLLTSPTFARWWYSQPRDLPATPRNIAVGAASLINALTAPQ